MAGGGGCCVTCWMPPQADNYLTRVRGSPDKGRGPGPPVLSRAMQIVGVRQEACPSVGAEAVLGLAGGGCQGWWEVSWDVLLFVWGKPILQPKLCDNGSGVRQLCPLLSEIPRPPGAPLGLGLTSGTAVPSLARQDAAP